MDRSMSFRGHLDELRKRLTISVLAVVVTTIISFVFYRRIIDFLLRPADAITEVPGRLVFIEVTEMFGVIMKVSLVTTTARTDIVSRLRSSSRWPRKDMDRSIIPPPSPSPPLPSWF